MWEVPHIIMPLACDGHPVYYSTRQFETSVHCLQNHYNDQKRQNNISQSKKLGL